MYFDPSVWVICPDVLYLALDDHPFLPCSVVCVLYKRYQTHHRVDCSFCSFFFCHSHPFFFVSLSLSLCFSLSPPVIPKNGV